jgi:hypothetical protein
MPIPPDAGPQVPDDENAYRVVVAPSQWDPSIDLPSSAFFDDDVISAELCSRATPQETVGRQVARGKKALYLVQFNCGSARQIGFDTRDERDKIDPDNIAHVHVYNSWYDTELGRSHRKAKAKLLSKLCSKVPF